MVLTALTVGLGLLIAVLVDRVRYETVAKSVIFVPLAISMVAASVIWTFMYWRSTPPDPQIGTLNAALGSVGVGPVAWIQVSDLGFNSISVGALNTSTAYSGSISAATSGGVRRPQGHQP